MGIFSRDKRPKPGVKDFNEGIYHRPPVGLSFFKTGILAAIVILLLSYFAYTKELPWSDEGYTATATFSSPATLRETAPVRIAGVNVGKVTKVEPAADGEGANVTFTVDDEGLPLHEDTRITVRPRLFLEGNFFLDVRPGSPSAPDLPDNGTIPVTQTATAVQLDEVLTALQAPDRKNLGKLLDGYGSALADKPTPELDVGQDPDVQGKSGAEALNTAFRYGGRAGKGTSQVNQALLGEQAGDLRDLIKASSSVFDQLASRESELSELITNFNITTGALAEESGSLQDTLAQLAPFAEEADGQLVEIQRSFPPLRAYARELVPGVRELPETIRAGNPWLTQADLLLRRSELGGIARDLRAATPPLSQGTANLTGVFSQLNQTSRCATNVLEPTGDVVINDNFNSAGSSNYKEFLYGLVSQAGEGGGFDGNGQFLRVQPGGGSVPTSLQIPNGATFPLPDDVYYGYSIDEPIGTQPLKPKKSPPVRTDVRCFTNDIPNLNGPQAAVGAPNPTAITP